MLYAADAAWWDHHRGVPEFAGERWTQDKLSFSRGGKDRLIDPAFAQRHALRVVRNRRAPGVSFDPACIHSGSNGGFQALNLAVLFGCRRILLLGFDMQKTGGKSHWFGDHPGKLNRAIPFAWFIHAFEAAAPQLAAAGIEVINCSRETALTCFPRQPIEAVL